MNDLIIIGASGFGREVAFLVERINAQKSTWNIVGFLDDDPLIKGTTIGGYPVLGTTDDVVKYPTAFFVCAVGSAKTRKLIVEKTKSIFAEINYATVIDPAVIISNRVEIGRGCIICAGTIITVDIRIGDHVIINLDCTVGHDAIINDYVTLYPSVNVSGITNISECVELGTGTQIIQGKTIGYDSIIGAGAVVVKDIPSKCTAVGSPAKTIKFHE